MSKLKDINDVARRLLDGLDYTDKDYKATVDWLLQYQTENQLTLEEMDNFCYEDSTWVFDRIYEYRNKDYTDYDDRGE